jgi:hypothetical protein
MKLAEIWTEEDNFAAAREGWTLSEAEDGVQIQRYDCAEEHSEDLGIDLPQLENDRAAWCLVVQGARRGSAVHEKALRLIGPEEKARIRDNMKAMNNDR